MQPKESKLTFVGEQAGAQFEGNFDKFTADISFDPKNLAASRFDVKIDTASVNTQDGERDTTIKSADLFDVKKFPSAQYVADKFTGQRAATNIPPPASSRCAMSPKTCPSTSRSRARTAAPG